MRGDGGSGRGRRWKVEGERETQAPLFASMQGWNEDLVKRDKALHEMNQT